MLTASNNTFSDKEIKSVKATPKRAIDAPPVIKQIHKARPDQLHGLFPTTLCGKAATVGYEPDPELRDAEQVPFLEKGGIRTFFKREVLPCSTDAWHLKSSARNSDEIRFTCHFYKPQSMYTLQEIHADILALEQEGESPLAEIIGETP